ncbi:P-loop containing nucleoside triphosphate hydrolase protein [Podospora aff. communis PSN243]|uniref:Guanylate kinase n=1 Tax=Podospora aff. communis PSN243 TaxID=3040156 RepID=A0AAV9H587_9PEZI|nr:P-loop containing nucleoside triphosphate hydrolase protein [Podospora aff. communis PSN243]
MRLATTTTLLRRALHTAVAKMPNLPPQRKPLVISGPSGVGKGTLYGLLFERNPDTFVLSVSHTTRGPRPGEEDGVHYHFVTKEAFLALKEKGGFVESAQFGGNFYGTSKQTIEEQSAKGKIVVLDIEMEGVKQIKATGFPARYVFIAPPSEEVLEKRLRGRGTDKEESILKRLAQAKLELEFAKTPGVHDKIIVNNDLEEAYKELVDFVYAPEA